MFFDISNLIILAKRPAGLMSNSTLKAKIQPDQYKELVAIRRNAKKQS